MKTNKKDRDAFFQKYGSEIANANMDKVAYLIEKAVKTKNPKLLDYEHIVAIGAPKNPKMINKTELADLLEYVYRYWIENNVKKRLLDQNMQFGREELESLVSEYDNFAGKKFGDENYDIVDFWNFEGDRWIGGIKSPVYFQGRYFCHFYTNVMNVNRFQFEKSCYDAKIYLNIKPENTTKLAKIFVEKAIKNNIPLTFKFSFFDERNDNFVMYSNYEQLDSMVKLVEETKKENKELFLGCKVKNPLLATFKGYMGFGEEPVYFGSYNSVRADAMQFAFKRLVEEFEKDESSLTKQNIQKVFAEECQKLKIDCNNFYLNKTDEHIFECEKEDL